MNFSAQDREIERQRYNTRACRLANERLGPDGAASVDVVLRSPYVLYEQLIAAAAGSGIAVLDVCCGDGVHSLCAARWGAEVTACDLAENNLELVQARAARAGLRVRTLVANAECVPLPAASFDVLTCAGGFSYVDLEAFLAEVTRLLRPNGAFIFVDSLNHNPVYRFNRYLRFLRGERSRSTLKRMPTCRTLARIRRDFPDLTVTYHGILSFLSPLLRWVGPERAASWTDCADSAIPTLRRFAFKVVGCGHRSA